MNASRFPRMMLEAKLLARRFGWTNALASFVAMMAALAWLSILPAKKAELEGKNDELARLSTALQQKTKPSAAPELSPEQKNFEDFYATLGDKAVAEQHIKTVFQLAKRASLMVAQAEYKYAYERNGAFYTYKIALPVKGEYRQIRRFCEQILFFIPFAAIDDIGFKREAVGDQQLEAKVNISFYLDGNARSRSLGGGKT